MLSEEVAAVDALAGSLTMTAHMTLKRQNQPTEALMMSSRIVRNQPRHHLMPPSSSRAGPSPGIADPSIVGGKEGEKGQGQRGQESPPRRRTILRSVRSSPPSFVGSGVRAEAGPGMGDAGDEHSSSSLRGGLTKQGGRQRIQIGLLESFHSDPAPVHEPRLVIAAVVSTNGMCPPTVGARS